MTKSLSQAALANMLLETRRALEGARAHHQASTTSLTGEGTSSDGRVRATVVPPGAAGDAEMIGQVVGSGLDEAEVVLIEALESVVDGVHWFADALRIMADNYERAEHENATEVDDAWPGD